jgi:hypothetical protein
MNGKMKGVVALALIAAVIGSANLILSSLPLRIDMTAEKLYTLSDGSKAVLGKLEEDVTLKFYFSASSAEMPMAIKTYATQVKNLLKEYELAGGGHLAPLGDEVPVAGLLGQLILTAGLANSVDQLVALIDGVGCRNLGHNVDAALHLTNGIVHLDIGIDRDKDGIVASTLGEFLVGLEGLGAVADSVLNIRRRILCQIIGNIANSNHLDVGMRSVYTRQARTARAVAQHC